MMWGALLLACVLGVILIPGRASSETLWIDELSNSLGFYKASYPDANWGPYETKLNMVREAIHRGDTRLVRTEMGKWFKMLRNRDNGIHDVAADELFNFGVMVTPIQEYGIIVPANASNP